MYFCDLNGTAGIDASDFANCEAYTGWHFRETDDYDNPKAVYIDKPSVGNSLSFEGKIVSVPTEFKKGEIRQFGFATYLSKHGYYMGIAAVVSNVDIAMLMRARELKTFIEFHDNPWLEQFIGKVVNNSIFYE